MDERRVESVETEPAEVVDVIVVGEPTLSMVVIVARVKLIWEAVPVAGSLDTMIVGEPSEFVVWMVTLWYNVDEEYVRPVRLVSEDPLPDMTPDEDPKELVTLNVVLLLLVLLGDPRDTDRADDLEDTGATERVKLKPVLRLELLGDDVDNVERHFV